MNRHDDKAVWATFLVGMVAGALLTLMVTSAIKTGPHGAWRIYQEAKIDDAARAAKDAIGKGGEK